ncbi:GNAT family N-acetyltransferase [Alkalibaculum sp. M08DMB]|uniref:GNAT family N-acetyltransferase n=1 Tax=Alkalibaculum sporogenes TaxID=2655001 RepID=A0A6A7KCB1_9FIRM|nr:GNAT family N-acetyltransferase [Alkalibaculum sporogenes]MPW26817.1 GNAT family N-acetyltransferase [Alkalibaculum sporogenes]
MEIDIRKYQDTDLTQMLIIWNNIIENADAFPQMDILNEKEAKSFFKDQTYTGIAVLDNQVVGLYILHPNNIGRCGHIANASYGVHEKYRGFGIGEKLVRHSMKIGKICGFSLLQFNAVVSSNTSAIYLYDKIGFHRVGTIPNGFLLGNEKFEEIIIYYIEL